MVKNLRYFSFPLILFFYLSVNGQFREVYTEGNPFNVINGISFFSGSKGYIATDNYVGYTVDSGRSFLQKYVTFFNVDFNGYSPNLTFGFHSLGVHAFSQDTLLIYGSYFPSPAILYSTNGGNSWKLVYHGDWRIDASEYNQGITDLKFQKNGNIGVAVHHDQILKSTNRGQTWNVVGNYIERKLKKITSPDFNGIWVIGADRVYKSVNYGDSWFLFSINVGYATTPEDLNFLTGIRGFLSVSSNSQGHQLLFTSDGGNSWTVSGKAGGSPMHFINDTVGYALGGNFTVVKTFDGGKIWEPLPRDNSFNPDEHSFFDCFYFFDNNLVWAGGGYGHLEMSTNAGGTTLPIAIFQIDTTLITDQHVIQLKNKSRKVYQYQWLRNGQLFATAFDASYSTPRLGIDTLMLIVSNGTNADTAITIFDTRIPHYPFADFTFTRDTSTVKFFASDTYSTVKHYWDFGDGTRDSINLNPIHRYDSLKTYVVKHVVVTPVDMRKDSTTMDVTITSIYNCVPADFTFDIDPFYLNKYTFHPIGLYPTITWMDWDWGDGTAHSGHNSATHTFDSATTYRVCMKMRNNTGCTTTVCKDVTINFRTDCYPAIQMIGGTPANPCHFDFVTPPFSGRKRHTWILDNRDTIVTGSLGYLQKNYAKKGPDEYFWFDQTYQTFRYTFHPDSIHRKLKHIVYDSATGCEMSFDTSFALKYKLPGVKMYVERHPEIPNYVNVVAIDTFYNAPIFPKVWQAFPWIGGSGGQQFGPGSNYLGNVLTYNFPSIGVYRVAFVKELPGINGNPQDIYEIFVNVDTVVACPQQPNFSYTFDPTDSATVNFTNATNYFGDWTSISSIKYYFGDGDSSNFEIASHTYATSGTFNVCIKFTNSNGCVKTLCKEIVINKSIDVILCPLRNTSLVSRISGNSYQWQVNDGTGYVNISDNALYQGTNNDTLNFITPPSSLYGYKYRCVVNGPSGTLYNHEYVLKFQNVWTGSFNTSWEHGSNWSCWVPPDENTDVVIEANGITPEISSNVTCRSLTVKSGATVIVHSGYTLTIKK